MNEEMLKIQYFLFARKPNLNAFCLVFFLIYIQKLNTSQQVNTLMHTETL